MKLIAWQYKRLKNANERYMRPVPERRVCEKRPKYEAAYHCLDPWTAETSGKWPGGRKSPYQATAKKNTEERQRVSEVASA